MQPTRIDIPLGKLDTRTDPLFLAPGDLSIAENVITQTNGLYRTRPGYQDFPTSVFGLRRLLTRDGELCAAADMQLTSKASAATLLSSWNAADQEWTPKGYMREAVPSRTPALRRQGQDAIPGGIALAEGKLYVVATSGINDGGLDAVGITVIDNETGSILLSNYSLIENGFAVSRTKMCATTDGFVIVTGIMETADATKFELRGWRIDPTKVPGDTGWITASQDLIGDVMPLHGGVYDVAPAFDGNFLLTFNFEPSAAPTSIEIRLILASDWSETAAVAYLDSGGSITLNGAIGCYASGAGELAYIGWCKTGSVLQFVTMSADDLSGASGINTFTTLSGSDFATNVTFIRENASTAGMAWDIGMALRNYILLGNTGAGGITTFFQMSLASKAWSYNNRCYFLGYYDAPSVTDSFQPTYFVIDMGLYLSQSTPLVGTDPMRHAGMAVYQNAGWFTASTARPNMLPNVVDMGDGSFKLGVGIRIKYLSESAPNIAGDVLTLTYTDKRAFAPVPVGGALLLTGGTVHQYDGKDVVDVGFPVYPERPSIATSTTGGNIEAGVRQYCATYERTDTAGNTHVSAPSLVGSATYTGTTSSGTVTLNYLSLDPIAGSNAALDLNRSPVTIGLYATETNLGVFYKIADIPNIRDADATTAAPIFVDNLSNAAVAVNTPLYTDGGNVLDHEPGQGCLHAVLHQGQVFYVPSEDPVALIYSPPYLPGQAISFASQNQVRAEIGGPITAIASLDDKVIIWKEDRIFQVSGTGAGQTGQGSTLTTPQLVSTDCGCIDARSLVSIPQGILFKSNKGLYLLSRALEVSYVGSPVDRYTTNYETVTSAVMMPDRREVRFTITDPFAPVITPVSHVLIYNYEGDKWSTGRITSEGWDTDTAVLWQGTHVLGRTSDGGIIQETPEAFVDPGDEFIETTLELGWICPAGLNGQARVQYALFSAEWISPHALELQVARNEDVTYTMSGVWDSETLADFNNSDKVSYNLPQQQGASFRVKARQFADASMSVDDYGEGAVARAVTLMAIVHQGSVEKLLQSIQKG